MIYVSKKDVFCRQKLFWHIKFIIEGQQFSLNYAEVVQLADEKLQENISTSK